MKKLLIFLVLGLAFFPFVSYGEIVDSPDLTFKYLYTCDNNLHGIDSEFNPGSSNLACLGVFCSNNYINGDYGNDEFIKLYSDSFISSLNGCENLTLVSEGIYNLSCSDYTYDTLDGQIFYDCVGYSQSFTPSGGDHGSAPIVGGVLDGIQLSNMGTALANGGASLLHIGIQLMPYAIAFTIILIIFTLIKNWSKLKNKLEDRYLDSYYMYHKNTEGSRKDWKEWKKSRKNNY